MVNPQTAWRHMHDASESWTMSGTGNCFNDDHICLPVEEVRWVPSHPSAIMWCLSPGPGAIRGSQCSFLLLVGTPLLWGSGQTRWRHLTHGPTGQVLCVWGKTQNMALVYSITEGFVCVGALRCVFPGSVELLPHALCLSWDGRPHTSFPGYSVTMLSMLLFLNPDHPAKSLTTISKSMQCTSDHLSPDMVENQIYHWEISLLCLPSGCLWVGLKGYWHPLLFGHSILNRTIWKPGLLFFLLH